MKIDQENKEENREENKEEKPHRFCAECYLSFNRLLKDEISEMDKKDNLIIKG